MRLARHSVNPLPLRERVAEGRVRGAPHQKRAPTPPPSPSVGRGEYGDPLNTYGDPPRNRIERTPCPDFSSSN
jgi:hypothetical protein